MNLLYKTAQGGTNIRDKQEETKPFLICNMPNYFIKSESKLEFTKPSLKVPWNVLEQWRHTLHNIMTQVVHSEFQLSVCSIHVGDCS